MKILNVSFDSLTFDETLLTLLGYLETNRNHMVVTPNPEALMLAQRNESFLNILQKADLVLADGIGILLAARLKGIPIPERVPGCDIAMALLQATASTAGRPGAGHSCYLLGAAPGVAEKARRKLQEQGITVVGAQDGYFTDENFILGEIRSLAPDILLVGMGMPRQEEWLAKHLHTLPCKISLCVGGSIDIISGSVRRAPKIMRIFGLEWLYRLVTNPRRARRMLDLPRFVWAVLMQM